MKIDPMQIVNAVAYKYRRANVADPSNNEFSIDEESDPDQVCGLISEIPIIRESHMVGYADHWVPSRDGLTPNKVYEHLLKTSRYGEDGNIHFEVLS